MSEHGRGLLPISFAVRRLSKPELDANVPVKLSLERDIRDGERRLLNEEERSRLVGEEGFSGRVDAQCPSDLCGVHGYLQLAPDLGQLHLGESILCYVSACNNSGSTLTQVEVVVEVVTQRASALLYENRDSPIGELPPDGQHDLVLRYDIKDVGEHNFRCMATYATAKRERITLPPHVTTFVAMSPLTIRTKTRKMGETCFLEACLESLKREEPFALEYVHFDPVKKYVATPILTEQEGQKEGPLKDYINTLSGRIMDAGHASRNFVFRLDPVLDGLRPEDVAVTSLGKLEIKWRTGFGETGRLQTQQIQLQQPQAAAASDIVGRIVDCVPQTLLVYHPFDVAIRLTNYTDDAIGPLTLTLDDGESVERRTLRMSGLEKTRIAALPSGESRDISIGLVSFRSGVQTICQLKMVDEETGDVVGTVESRDVFVAPLEDGFDEERTST